MYYCSGTGMTLTQRKGRRLRSEYPLLMSSKINKLNFHYCILNTMFVRFFNLIPCSSSVFCIILHFWLFDHLVMVR
jgi:hypothetical protein